MRQLYKRSSAILLLLPVLLATVASVPTSVLVQNSESDVATNNDIVSLNNLKSINKVKRSSSGNGKSGSEDLSTSTVSALSNNNNNNNYDKKSSPEVVPAVYNSPPVRPIQMAQSVERVSYGLPENPELINTAIAAGLTAAAAAEAAAVAHQRKFDRSQIYDEEPPTLLYKRGINTAEQQAYTHDTEDHYYNNPFLTSASSSSQLPRNGVWADELDPITTYNLQDLQELDDYAPMQQESSYHNKAYDNLQNLLNTEAYLEPAPLPYKNRYYSSVDADRNKRSNPIKYNRYAMMRPKQDVKLSAGDMLALVALVEAGERTRNDEPEISVAPQRYSNDVLASKSGLGGNVGIYDYPAAAGLTDETADQYNLANSGTVYEPNSIVDYYGSPMNVDTMPKYEYTVPRDRNHDGRNHFGVKRYMVAKRNRPLGKFLNEPVAKPSISYNLNDEYYY